MAKPRSSKCKREFIYQKFKKMKVTIYHIPTRYINSNLKASHTDGLFYLEIYLTSLQQWYFIEQSKTTLVEGVINLYFVHQLVTVQIEIYPYKLITNWVPADSVKYKTPVQNWNSNLAEIITMNAFISS